MKNKILLGDCLDLMQNIPSGSIDMVLCDLPYGTTKNKWDTIIPFDSLWAQYTRVIKPNGVIILFSAGVFTAQLICSNILLFRYDIIWEKTTPTGFLNAKKMPLRNHENICVFYKKLPTYNPQKTTGHVRKVSSSKHKRNSKQTTNYGAHKLNSYDSTERYPLSVVRFPTDKQKSALHPTQKPVPLFEYLIKTYTNEGETVLDNCSGSGTTAIAALNTGRSFICKEKDPSLHALSTNRLNTYVSDIL